MNRETHLERTQQGFWKVRISEMKLCLKPGNIALLSPIQEFAGFFGKALSFCVSLFVWTWSSSLCLFCILCMAGRSQLTFGKQKTIMFESVSSGTRLPPLQFCFDRTVLLLILYEPPIPSLLSECDSGTCMPGSSWEFNESSSLSGWHIVVILDIWQKESKWFKILK